MFNKVLKIGLVIEIIPMKGYRKLKNETNNWIIAQEIKNSQEHWFWIVNQGNKSVQARLGKSYFKLKRK